MTKPDDIPQDVLNRADEVWTDLANIHRSRDGETEIIARAIMAERGACASVTPEPLELPKGTYGLAAIEAFWAGAKTAREAFASAIRNRGAA